MRKPLPDILAAAPAQPLPGYDLAAAMAAPGALPARTLRYNYVLLGLPGPAIADHALAIKRAEGRMAADTVEVGNHLIAVKETIPHGHWLPWLNDELGMSDDAAQRMMGIARRFGSKTDTLRYLTPSVLGLLAVKSVPDAAVDAAIAAAAVSPVTVTAAKAIIAMHKSTARCRVCHKTLTDPAAIRAGIGACCAGKLARGAAQQEARGESTIDDRPLPEWATDDEAVAVAPEFPTVGEPPDHRPYPEVFAELRDKFGKYFNDDAPAEPDAAPSPAPPQPAAAVDTKTHTDGRDDTLARLAQRLSDLIGVMRELGQSYGEVTGDHMTPLEVKHLLERMQVKVQSNMPDGGWD